ncbi:MAG: hypothetical protein ABS54_16495 [Hyphomicrobium sp. SCN 65-11]|nr:MAG: hypothetical protein ABS54_16495 [Hyphomicrobium sp. SCN 65-11]
MSRPENEPGGIAWLTGLLGMMLPWIAVPLGVYGVFTAIKGSASGWWLTVAAAGLLALDFLIDLFWARRARGRSEEPLLNRREAQTIGRVVRVVEPISGGEGKVRVGDSVWRARGPDCAVGPWVRVVGAEGGYLLVVTDEAAAGPAAGA